MIISGQTPSNQTPEAKMRQDQQMMQIGQKGASYLKRPQQQPNIPAMGQPGTAPQPTMQQLMGAGGIQSACPTCGGQMNSSNTDEEMGMNFAG
jgi:hypothetical protein